MLFFYLSNGVWESWDFWRILATKQYRTKAVYIFQMLSKIEKYSLIVPLHHLQQGYYLPFCGCLPAIVNPWMRHLLSTSLWKPECSKWNVAITVFMLVNCPVFLEACTSTGLWNIIFTPPPSVNNYREVRGGRINHQYSFLQRLSWSRFFYLT